MQSTLADEPVRNTPNPDAGERGPSQPEPGNQPARGPGNEPAPPDADNPPTRREGVVSNPDF